MIGFKTTREISEQITDGVNQAQLSRGKPVTWTIVGVELTDGSYFIQADDDVLTCNIVENSTPQDFPEFAMMIGMLGGLENRVDVSPDLIKVE